MSRRGQPTDSEICTVSETVKQCAEGAAGSLKALKAGQEPYLHRTFSKSSQKDLGQQLLHTPVCSEGFPGGSGVKNLPAMRETRV